MLTLIVNSLSVRQPILHRLVFFYTQNASLCRRLTELSLQGINLDAEAGKALGKALGKVLEVSPILIVMLSLRYRIYVFCVFSDLGNSHLWEFQIKSGSVAYRA